MEDASNAGCGWALSAEGVPSCAIAAGVLATWIPTATAKPIESSAAPMVHHRTR